MDETLKSCVVKTTEHAAGDVVGKLNQIGAWLTHMDRINELIIIEVNIPELQINSFREWLAIFTNDEGEFNDNA